VQVPDTQGAVQGGGGDVAGVGVDGGVAEGPGMSAQKSGVGLVAEVEDAKAGGEGGGGEAGVVGREAGVGEGRVVLGFEGDLGEVEGPEAQVAVVGAGGAGRGGETEGCEAEGRRRRLGLLCSQDT